MTAKRLSCTLPLAALLFYSAVFFIGKALPANLIGLRYKNSLLGLGGNVSVLAQRCQDSNCQQDRRRLLKLILYLVIANWYLKN